MRNIVWFLFVFVLFSFVAFAQDVYVHGYYRKDGTYVRPHYRSRPDGVKYNNYGRASYRQRQQYQGYSVIPSYNNDYDNDGLANRYDYDDDNDGIYDDYDSSQYGRQRSSNYVNQYSTQGYNSGYGYGSSINQNDNYGYGYDSSSYLNVYSGGDE